MKKGIDTGKMAAVELTGVQINKKDFALQLGAVLLPGLWGSISPDQHRNCRNSIPPTTSPLPSVSMG